MKFSKILPACIIVFLILGCTRNSKEIIDKKIMTDQEIIKLFSTVGKLHNQGLDSIFKFLKSKVNEKKPILNRLTDPEEGPYITSLLEINQLSENFLQNNLGFTGMNINPYYLTDLSYSSPSTLFQNSTFVSHYNSLYPNETISSDLAVSLNALEGLLRNDDRINNYEKYDSLLQVKISTISSQTDKAAFAGCVSVIKNSSKYWNENQADWNTLRAEFLSGNGIVLTDRKSPNEVLKDMVWADGSGALTGLIRGGIAGAAGGTVALPGLGTVTGAVAGALAGGFVMGATASAGAAITGIVQWVINW